MNTHNQILSVLTWTKWTSLSKPKIIDNGFYSVEYTNPFIVILENGRTRARITDVCYMAGNDLHFYKSGKMVSSDDYHPIYWAELPFDIGYDSKFI